MQPADWHKPEGRGRHFERLARGLARRLRIPFVRETRWVQEHPGARFRADEYALPWTSDHAMADFSFACACHPNERWARAPKHRERALVELGIVEEYGPRDSYGSDWDGWLEEIDGWWEDDYVPPFWVD